MANLTCCCCGASCKGKQHWNRDKGYGLCPKCAKWIKGGRESAEDMLVLYGVAGVNYFEEE